ncbi:MAG: S8 family serine peptidase [Pseudomonadota bacterium]
MTALILKTLIPAITASLSGCSMTSVSVDQPVEVNPSVNEIDLSDDANVLLLVKSGHAADELVVNVTRRGYQLIDRQYLRGLDLILLDFKRPNGVSGEVAINDMKAMEPSAVVGLDHLYELQQSERTSDQGRLYANDMIGWPPLGCRAQTSVGLIDGFLPLEVTLPGATQVTRQDFTRGANGAQDHAETVASLLVGPGRLNETDLHAAGVIGLEGGGVSELIRAIDWMAENEVKVVNISLSGPQNRLLELAVERAAEQGMVLIAAAGNDGPLAEPRYPAALEDVIAVTAIDGGQDIFDRAVQGSHIDFAAPGVEIFIQSGSQSGTYLSGTSLAVPFVTALVASDQNQSFADGVQTVREDLASHAIDLGLSGPDEVYGHGLIQSQNRCMGETAPDASTAGEGE